MPFEKGKEKSGGRKKGTRNQFTRFKDASMEAFNSEEVNGVVGLIEWAKSPENRGEFYRLLPREIELTDNRTSSLAEAIKAARESKSGK